MESDYNLQGSTLNPSSDYQNFTQEEDYSPPLSPITKAKRNFLNSENKSTMADDQSHTYFEKWEAEMHRYKFKGKVFIKFFLFYLLYFAGLGPIILLCRVIIRNKFLHNLAEITSKGRRPFKIILTWAIPLLYFAFFEGKLTFQYAEIIMLLATLIFIAVSQSTMVAYAWDGIEEDLYQREIPYAQLVRITTLGSHTIKEEFKIVAIRLNIDLPILYFNFLSDKPGKPSLMRRTPDNESDLHFEGRDKSYSMGSSLEAINFEPIDPKKFVMNECDFTKSYGENLAMHLLEKQDSRSLSRQIFGWSLFQSLIPVIYQIIASKPSPSETSEFVWFIVLIIAFWVLNFVCAYFVMEILVVTLVNLHRRIYLMKEMKDLIAPSYQKRDGTPKIYNLNFVDPMSLTTWIRIRKILMHYGDREMKTTAVSITLVMGFHLIMVILTVLSALNILAFGSSFYEYGIIFGVGSIVYFVLLVRLIWSGASLNKQYTRHKAVLHANKSIVTSLIRSYPSFLSSQPLKPQTYAYREGLKKLKEEFGRDSTPKQREDKLHLLLEAYDDMIEELDFEEINNPFRLMGISTTSTLTKSLLAGLFSIVIAATPKVLSTLTQ